MTFLPIETDAEQAGHALVAVPNFTAFAQWHSLRDELVPFIGERAVSLFAYSIADANDCLVTTAYLRKILVESGENVDNPQVTESEQLLMDWGRLIAQSPNAIPDEMYERLEKAFNPRLRLILVAFAGQTVATDLLNSVGRIPLEEAMYPYRRVGDSRTR
jgi:hypothetical protein